MDKATFHLINPEVRKRVKGMIDKAPDGYMVVISEPTRNLDQNAKLWPTLNDIATQLEWHGRKMSTEEWKCFFTAALIQQQVVPNMDGTGFIVLGTKTSTMSKRLFSDLLELALSFGCEHGVVWSEPTEREES